MRVIVSIWYALFNIFFGRDLRNDVKRSRAPDMKDTNFDLRKRQTTLEKRSDQPFNSHVDVILACKARAFECQKGSNGQRSTQLASLTCKSCKPTIRCDSLERQQVPCRSTLQKAS